VRKLLNHANDEGATEKEAETFMHKAREIMIRNDMKMEDILGDARLFVKRPLGNKFKRFPTWMFEVGHLLAEHYNVKMIRSFVKDKDLNEEYYLEIFGEPSNVDIAEYVGHALITQAKYLYKKFKKSERTSFNRISQKAFITGLVRGYKEKLNENLSETTSKIEAEEGFIIPQYNGKLLKEMYGQAYPNMRTLRSAQSRAGGFGAGERAGRSLSLAKGVKGGSGKVLQLS
jgi:hypothetical protein